MSVSDETALEMYRATFDGEPGYLDWAGFGPVSPAVRSELHADAELLGSGRLSGMSLVDERAGAARELLGELLGARTDEVSLQPSTTHGLQQAVYGLSGGVMVGRREFAALTVTVTRAAESLGRVQPQWLEPADGFITPDAVREALTEDTRALVVSLVDFRTGYRVDLPALRDVLGEDRLLIVDAVQAFGVVDVDYGAADVVCGHGYKWLRSGRGTGFAWFGPRAQERIAPVLSGLTGMDVEGLPDTVERPAATGRAFTVSLPDTLAAARLATGLREVRDAGPAAIEAEIAARTADVMFFADRYEIEVVTPREPERRAGIVALRPRPRDVAPLAASLANHGLTVTARGDLIRVSAHVGTDADTLRLFGDALAGFAYARVE
ncbi:MAG: aminotransferase class V-fold PLP-dependent enzyme [Microbacterium sp.]|uniref:aminotransferase class V-fold PLP-dependent enzyme n=1 Tax=Microbacterium sp. TaxID=51671 RepID=UPI003A8B6E1C